MMNNTMTETDKLAEIVLRDIRTVVGNKNVLSLAEASKITGLDARSLKTCPDFPGRPINNEPGCRYVVSVVALAYWIVGKGVH